MPDIDQARIEEMAKAEELLKRLYSSPKHKRALEKMAKDVNPAAVTTDDIAAPFLDEVRSELKPILEWKAKMEGQIKEYNQAEEIKKLKSGGYTDDGIKEIQKIAEDKKVDLDMAAAYFDKTRPVQPQAPNGLSPSMWNFRDDLTDKDDLDALFKGNAADEDAALDRMAGKAMQEWAQMKGTNQ